MGIFLATHGFRHWYDIDKWSHCYYRSTTTTTTINTTMNAITIQPHSKVQCCIAFVWDVPVLGSSGNCKQLLLLRDWVGHWPFWSFAFFSFPSSPSVIICIYMHGVSAWVSSWRLMGSGIGMALRHMFLANAAPEWSMNSTRDTPKRVQALAREREPI